MSPERRDPATDQLTTVIGHADRAAGVSLALGVASLALPPLGIFAVILGRRATNGARGEGARQRAVVGTVMGCISMCTVLATLAAWPLLERDATVDRRVTASRASPVALKRADPAGPRPSPGQRGSTDVRRVGGIEVVGADPAIASLAAELAAQHREAGAFGRRLLLLATIVDCDPCDAVLGALATPPIQYALAGTRVIVVSADDFAVELARLGLPIDAFPGFALIGDGGRVVDYIHGGEWDDDVPGNMAPILESFVRGTYHDRRDAWSARRDDETPI